MLENQKELFKLIIIHQVGSQVHYKSNFKYKLITHFCLVNNSELSGGQNRTRVLLQLLCIPVTCIQVFIFDIHVFHVTREFHNDN